MERFYPKLPFGHFVGNMNAKVTGGTREDTKSL
jgi:hypothetical protein